MKIQRHHVTTPSGANFWLLTEDRALRFAEKSGGKYHGLKTIPQDSLPEPLKDKKAGA